MVAVALLLSGYGQAKPKVYRVGILSGLGFVANTADGFKEGMAELGYIESENIVYDLHKVDAETNTATSEQSSLTSLLG